MNLKQLEAFVEVAESGSFSKAAKRLFLTQPTVSAHILALEKELDIRLFVRNTKEVCLTEEGQRLYFYARQMADLQYKIKEEFGHRKTEQSGGRHRGNGYFSRGRGGLVHQGRGYCPEKRGCHESAATEERRSPCKITGT